MTLLRDRDAPPDVVITDLLMGPYSGVWLYQQMAEDDTLSSVPIIVLSTVDPKLDLGFDMDAAAVLQKPVESQQLLKIVEKYCGRYPGHS